MVREERAGIKESLGTGLIYSKFRDGTSRNANNKMKHMRHLLLVPEIMVMFSPTVIASVNELGNTYAVSGTMQYDQTRKKAYHRQIYWDCIDNEHELLYLSCQQN